MTRRESSGRRRAAVRQSRVLVYCGAARTEPDYFEGLRAAFRSASVTVEGTAGWGGSRAFGAALWLLLHHADCRSHCSGYADVATRLRRHVPAYDKSRLRFADYAAGVTQAHKRAKELEPTGIEHRQNPSTNVWRLVEIITEKS